MLERVSPLQERVEVQRFGGVNDAQVNSASKQIVQINAVSKRAMSIKAQARNLPPNNMVGRIARNYARPAHLKKSPTHLTFHISTVRLRSVYRSSTRNFGT